MKQNSVRFDWVSIQLILMVWTMGCERPLHDEESGRHRNNLTERQNSLYGQGLDVGKGVIELGIVKPGVSIEGELQIQNSGSTLVQFSKVRPSCSCSSVSLIPNELQPGEMATLKVIVKPTISSTHTLISVYCKGGHEFQVPVIWECSSDIQTDKDFLDFGEVVLGSTNEQSIGISLSDVLKSEWDSLNIRVEPSSDLTVERTSVGLNVRLIPTQLGFVSGFLRVEDSSTRVLLELPVLWDSSASSSKLQVSAKLESSIQGKLFYRVLVISRFAIDVENWSVIDEIGNVVDSSFEIRNEKSAWGKVQCLSQESNSRLDRQFSIVDRQSGETLVDFRGRP